MRSLARICSLTLLLTASTLTTAGSLTPGWYFGVIGGGGSMKGLEFENVTQTFGTVPQTAFYTLAPTPTGADLLQNTVVGKKTFGLLGDVGLQFGYRYCNFRFEGEFLFGGSSTKRTQLYNPLYIRPATGLIFSSVLEPLFITGDNVLISPAPNPPPNPDPNNHNPILTIINDTYTSGHTYFVNNSPNLNFRYKERQVFYSGFLNLIYDFYPEHVDVSLVPYIGLGVGAMHFQNTFSGFYSNYTIASTVPLVPFEYDFTLTSGFSATVGQAIVGATYLLDDFSNIGLDFRYIASRPISQFNDNSIGIYTLNLVFNYTFDTF